jgi:hypothetical protein
MSRNNIHSGPRDRKETDQDSTTLPDMTPRREGGDDAIAESSPDDNRLDEKVIVNEQRGNKTVNAPSQTASNASETTGNDEEILD